MNAQSHCANPVTLENFRQGLDQLFKHLVAKKQSREGEWDFHDELYRRCERQRKHGLNEEFWDKLVDDLWAWRAIRGQKVHTKNGIRAKGLERLSALKGCLDRLIAKSKNELPTIETVEWRDVKPLFDIAHEIKGVSSPMFASKLCHFLVPSAYFVTDRKLVRRGWKDYQSYWEDCRAAWLCQSDKQGLKDELRERMPSQPCSSFPWGTKITELCQFDVDKSAPSGVGG